MNAGTMTLEASATAPATDSTYGHQIKTADATRTLVGRVTTNASSQFSGGSFDTPNGVVSYFNPLRYLHLEQILIGSSPGTGIDVADNSSTYGFMTATTSNTLATVHLVGTARIKFARLRAVWSSNNAGNKVRLVHFDDGPANITQVHEFTTAGAGTPVNDAADVTSTLAALQDGIVNKNLGIQVFCVNGSVFTVYKMALEYVLDMDAF